VVLLKIFIFTLAIFGETLPDYLELLQPYGLPDQIVFGDNTSLSDESGVLIFTTHCRGHMQRFAFVSLVLKHFSSIDCDTPSGTKETDTPLATLFSNEESYRITTLLAIRARAAAMSRTAYVSTCEQIQEPTSRLKPTISEQPQVRKHQMADVKAGP
jgi:hypothetical protein